LFQHKQQDLWTPLLKQVPDPLPADIAALEEKAHSMLLFALEDHIITEITDEDTDVGLECKLESKYMTKSLINKLPLKQHLFSVRMHEGMSLREHLDQLNSTLLYLYNIDININHEDVVLIILAFLPSSYKNFNESSISGKDSLSLKEVSYAL